MKAQIEKLLHGVNLWKPTRVELYQVLKGQLRHLNPGSNKDTRDTRIAKALRIAFTIHQGMTRDEKVADKNIAYVIHCVRVALAACIRMRMHKVFSLDLVLIALCHDSIEDILKSKVNLAELEKRLLTLGGTVYEGVKTLSATDGELDEVYYTRMLLTVIVIALIVKVLDRIDNLQSLVYRKDEEHQRRKVWDSERQYRPLFARILYLVWEESLVGNLELGWYGLVLDLKEEFDEAVAAQKRRLGMT